MTSAPHALPRGLAVPHPSTDRTVTAIATRPGPVVDDGPTPWGGAAALPSGAVTAVAPRIGAPGGPGPWGSRPGPTSEGALHLLPEPVRVYDSRPASAPADGPKTPLPAGYLARTIDLGAEGEAVPAGALGALVTVLLFDADAGSGRITIWAEDRPKPRVATLAWGGDAGHLTTTVVTGVDREARVRIDSRLRTDVAIDVVGYLR